MAERNAPRLDRAARNAAIYYASDGFDPAAKGINGRRVAGDSFLRGYLRHGVMDEAVLISRDCAELKPVRALAEGLRPGLDLRHVPLRAPGLMAPVSTLFFPSPNFATHAWRRAAQGSAAWSICGITHTTSTVAVMRGIFDLALAPVGDWDAVICTSRAVQASVSYQYDLAVDYLKVRLGATLPPRPMLPVIPLGVHCDEHQSDHAAGADLRARLGAGERDMVLTTIARLSPQEKFDPLPVYTALQRAQRVLGAGQRLHLVLCGIFADGWSRRVFEAGARVVMPDVNLLILDGAEAGNRRAALSGADAFVFLIDNIQETFGLAPLEAMAAGLPMIVSDWDGMKDTVTPDVGIRVTTRALPARHTAEEALRHLGGVDSHGQYLASVSAVTEIDIDEAEAAILALARDPMRRRAMAEAARARARFEYDWSVIIPRMQDLWAEQVRRRRAGAARQIRLSPESLPVAPAPGGLFSAYPTEVTEHAGHRFAAAPRDGLPGLSATLAARDYLGMKRIFADPKHIAAVLDPIAAAGPVGLGLEEVLAACGLAPQPLDRILIWLLKYGFVRRL